MSRVRFQLSGPLAAAGASCAHLWWPFDPSSPLQIKQLIREVLDGVGLTNLSLDTIKVTLDGFTVLMNSLTGLLRDGELLEIDFAASQNATTKKRALENAITPAPKKAAKTAEEKDQQTPTNAVVAAPPSETRPSRSARRKAAKRLRKRQGLAVSFPVDGRRRQQQQQQPKAAQNGRFKATALAAVEKKDIPGSSPSSSLSSQEKSDSEEEETTSSSSDASSENTSSSSSSGEEEVGEEKEENSREMQTKVAFDSIVNFDFSTMPRCDGVPEVGRVVAYKLLELGQDYAPRISEPRIGKVIAIDTTENAVITIEPYPDPSIHPEHPFSFGNKSIENIDSEEEEEEERDPPPSAYDEDGILTTDLAAIAELKYYSRKDGDYESNEGDLNGENNATSPTVKGDVEPLGPTNYSRLGPPAAPLSIPTLGTTPPSAIKDPEVLASLVEQLQQRRAEIASSEKEIPAKTDDEKKTTTATKQANNNKNNQKKKKNPSQRGALQSAIGPILRMLRDSEDL